MVVSGTVSGQATGQLHYCFFGGVFALFGETYYWISAGGRLSKASAGYVM